MAGENESGTDDAPQNGPAGAQQGGEGAGQDAPANGPASDEQGQDEGKPNGDAPAKRSSESETDWKARARQHEDRAKANRKAADEAAAKAKTAEDRLAAVLKAAGLADGDQDEDPTEAVKRAAKERDDALAESKALKAERTAERVALRLGADVVRTLDSRAVEKALAALDDPTDEDAVKSVITAALKEHPHLKAQPSARPSANADMAGAGATSAGASGIEARRAAYRKSRGS